jgi:hypothetical protein
LSWKDIEDEKAFLEYAVGIDRKFVPYPWSKLNKLFQYPWFLRLWAHQEYAVALKVKALTQYRFELFDKIAEFASRLQIALARVNWEESFDPVPWPRHRFLMLFREPFPGANMTGTRGTYATQAFST